jgi:NAD(P)-dependent dehydrogenase (short-subunit alcohol dehydrogenase family)
VPVVVLNGTSRTGLAAEVAKRLRAKGWTVTTVGNWRGGIKTTTVYATGRKAAAATMRYDAKPADATRPTRDGMPTDRIVLVIGPDFPILAGR